MRWLVALALLQGCSTDLEGPCDPETAREVVHSADGDPAYAGQALLHQSCGHGRYCHGSDVEGANRLGAPRGLELDIDLASRDGSVGDVERLRAVQNAAHERRAALWAEVERGTMPPGGVGRVALETAPTHLRLVDGVRVPLPGLDTAAGREVLRNWLVCGLPVVERSRARDDGLPAEVGSVVASACTSESQCAFPASSRCEPSGSCGPCVADPDCAHLGERSLCAAGLCVRPVEPTWASIHEVVVTATCALEFCHGDAEGNNEAGLDLRGVAASYARLSGPVAGDECGPLAMPLLTPGDPDRSLLYRKLFATPGAEDDEALCGYRMPYAADPLPSPWAEAIAEWIRAGALGP